MSALMKSLGVIILLIGVGVLTIPSVMEIRSNTFLGAGLIIIIAGFLSHIFLNKKFEK
jgi:uncharacterized membrane protein HdeD (DUF308 family)